MDKLSDDIIYIIFDNCKNLNMLMTCKNFYNLSSVNISIKNVVEDIKNGYFYFMFSNVFNYDNISEIYANGLIRYSSRLPLDNPHFIKFINDYDCNWKAFDKTLIYYTTIYYKQIAITVNRIINNLLKTNYPHLFLLN